MNQDLSFVYMEHYGEDFQPKINMVVGTLIAIMLGILLLSFSIYLIYKVYKLVKFEDKPMLLSIISISLSLICLITF
jgi:hypothetical protein